MSHVVTCCIVEAGGRIVGLCPTAVKAPKEKQELNIALGLLSIRTCKKAHLPSVLLSRIVQAKFQWLMRRRATSPTAR